MIEKAHVVVLWCVDLSLDTMKLKYYAPKKKIPNAPSYFQRK
jgi:hypothetical protein